MAKSFLIEKRSHIVISIGVGLFNCIVVTLIGRTFSAQSSWFISSLTMSFFSSLAAGALWSSWKPSVVIWTWSQVLFWGSAGIIASFVYTNEVCTEWCGLAFLALMPFGGIVGCIFGIALGAISYSKILAWESKTNINAIIGWTAGIFSGIIINVLAIFVTTEINISGAIIGALCGLLTGLVISRFSLMELKSHEIKNA